MSQLILSRGISGRSFLKNLIRRYMPNINIGPYFLLVSLIVFVIAITVITLMFSTRQVTKGYVLNKLESQHRSLVRESELNEMEISTVRSLSHIRGSAKVSRMTTPSNVAYLSGESAIASR